MARSLEYLRDQAHLVEQLTHEANAARALADEARRKLDVAKSKLMKDAIKEYQGGATPKDIYEMSGIPRPKLHYNMNRPAKRKRR